MDALLDVKDCKRRRLNRYEYGKGYCYFGFEERTITSTHANGQVNAKARAKALWQELKRLLSSRKFAAMQARELWSMEERVHMRPGYLWACELGDAGDLLADASRKDSPILVGPFESRQFWPPNESEPGWKEAFRGIPRYR
mmetsp:Transcript_25167/g.54373  ORF Transcript_25167/g.54373 Transcript_25167/m.54373 type:complete len:141 (-) Transcript_25167:577-999(-)